MRPRRRRKQELGARVFILVGAGVLLPLFVLGALSVSALDTLRAQILTDREEWARGVAARLDDLLRGEFEILQQVASAPDIDLADGDIRPEHEALRAAWLQLHSSDSMFVLDAAGRLLHEEPSHGTRLPDEIVPLAQAALRSERPVVSGVLPGFDGGPRIYVLSAVRNWELRVVGLVGLATDPAGPRLAGLLRAARPGADGSVDLLDDSGAAFATSGPTDPSELAAHTPWLRDLIRRRGSSVHSCSDCHTDGPQAARHEILAAAALELAPWAVRTRQPEMRPLALARTTPGRLVVASAILFGLAAFFAWGVARSVRRPLAVLTSSAESIAAGNLDAPIPALGDDEIGRLGRSLEHMRVELRELLARLEDAKAELEGRVVERTRQLGEANRELRLREEARAQLLRKVITAQEDERRRLARELHDETSQTLTALMLRIDTAGKRLANDAGREVLDEVKTIAVRALDEVHRLVLDLRPSVLDDLGLLSAIQWIVDRHLTPAGITARCEFDLDKRLAPEIETALFRVTQEAVTNIARHSGADNVLIQVGTRAGVLVLEIEDDGKGFDVAAVSQPDVRRASFGLLGIRERIELLGGTVDIDAAPGEGTRIAARVPVGEE